MLQLRATRACNLPHALLLSFHGTSLPVLCPKHTFHFLAPPSSWDSCSIFHLPSSFIDSSFVSPLHPLLWGWGWNSGSCVRQAPLLPSPICPSLVGSGPVVCHGAMLKPSLCSVFPLLL